MTQRPALRPADAASLILADATGAEPLFLMGRRSGGHVFMAHNRVFPGGRVERSDSHAQTPDALATTDMERLADELGGGRGRSRRAAAFGTCALRETREETGLVLADIALLTPIRYVARAITPPGQVRRYDTRFFLASVDRARLDFASTDGELAEIDWYPLPTDDDDAVHRITRVMMRLAHERLRADPALVSDAPVPCFRVRNGRRVVEYPADGAFP